MQLVQKLLYTISYVKSVDLLTESITYEDFLSGEPLDSYYKAFYPTPETNNIVK